MHFSSDDRALILSAVEIYLNEADKFTTLEIALRAEVPAKKAYDLAADKWRLLALVYPLMLEDYKTMTHDIEGFDSARLSEKLNNLAFSLFDLFSDNEKLIAKTWRPLIFEKKSDAVFHQSLTSYIKETIDSDPFVSASSAIVSGDWMYSFLALEYIHLIHFWTKDDSPGKEKTLALTDKLSSFIEEGFYSAVLDKGLDLAKYLLQNQVFKLPFGLNRFFYS